MKNYKLLTPGPLTTTDTVKKEMLFDHCTWDDDYKVITQEIRARLLKLAHVSGSRLYINLDAGKRNFWCGVGTHECNRRIMKKLLICANGAYGERMADIAEHAKIAYCIYNEKYDQIPDAGRVAQILDEDSKITHVSMVHSETTSGIINDIEAVAKVVKEKGRTMIVDAMSSFGGVDIPVADLGIVLLSAAQINASRVYQDFLSSLLIKKN